MRTFSSGNTNMPTAVIDAMTNKKTRPIRSADDLACDGIFGTDEELEEFLAYTCAARRADLAWQVTRVVLETDEAFRSSRRLLPPRLVAELIGREPLSPSSCRQS